MRILRGKRVLITGAANGLGRALAMAFAAEGAHLFLLDVDQEGLAQTRTNARRLGVDVHDRCCDLTRNEDLVQSYLDVLAEWGTLDILVNNAGVNYYGPTTLMTDEQWQWLLAVNLLAPIRLIHLFLPTLLRLPQAHILNVCSFCSFVTTARSTAYHASKFGLLGLTEALRTEFYRYGLGVTAVCPGFMRTGLFQRMALAPGSRERTPPQWLSSLPERVAEKAIRGIRRNQRLVLVSPLGYASYYVKRFAPGLLDWAFRQGGRRMYPKIWLPADEMHQHYLPFCRTQQDRMLRGCDSQLPDEKAA
jgi:short-subunit dehydrogenase